MATKARAGKAPSRRARKAPAAKSAKKARKAPRARAASKAPKSPSRPGAEFEDFEGFPDVTSIISDEGMSGFLAARVRECAGIFLQGGDISGEEERAAAVRERMQSLGGRDLGETALALCVLMCQAIKAGADGGFTIFDKDPECFFDADTEISGALVAGIGTIRRIAAACRAAGEQKAEIYANDIIEGASEMERLVGRASGINDCEIDSANPGAEIHLCLSMAKIRAKLLVAQAVCAMESHAVAARRRECQMGDAMEALANADEEIDGDDWAAMLGVREKPLKFPAPKTGCQCCGVKVKDGAKRCGSCDTRLGQDVYPCGWPDDAEECACRADAGE